MTQIFKFLKDYWIVITAIVTLIGAGSIFPFRLEALESRQEKFEQTQEKLVEQTMTIADYVKGQETEKAHEKELQESAPKGFRWDSLTREYVKK